MPRARGRITEERGLPVAGGGNGLFLQQPTNLSRHRRGGGGWGKPGGDKEPDKVVTDYKPIIRKGGGLEERNKSLDIVSLQSHLPE